MGQALLERGPLLPLLLWSEVWCHFDQRCLGSTCLPFCPAQPSTQRPARAMAALQADDDNHDAGPSRQSNEPSDAADPPLPTVSRENILFLGLRRSGKSSIVNVVYKSLAPDDSLFLESTLRCQACDVDTFQLMRIWDGTGAELEGAALGQQQPPQQQQQHPINGTTQRQEQRKKNGSTETKDQNQIQQSGKGKAACGTNGQLYWTECGAVVFVIDSQDEWYDAIDRLHDIILEAYASNPLIHFHVFVHKVDGHSQDYRYDTLQQIERRVADNLAEASPSFIFAPSGQTIVAEALSASPGGSPDEERDRNRSKWSALRDGAGGSYINESAITGQPSSFGPDLERDVCLSYHATSIYNADILVACSRVQIDLMDAEVRKTLDALCSGLCSSCKFEKVYLFDVPTKTYIAADSSPYDENNFEAISEYLKFLIQFSGLYRNLSKFAEDGKKLSTSLGPSYTASAVRLSSDTTLGFHQVNSHLALAFVVRTDIHMKKSGMIDFNIAIARKAIIDVYETCNA